MRSAYPVLTQLLGGYFHQDFLDEFGSEKAVFAVIRLREHQSILIAVSELRSLLNSDADEERLGEILIREIGMYFDPASRGSTYRQWVGHAIVELNGQI